MLRWIRLHTEYQQFHSAGQSCRLPHFYVPLLKEESPDFAFGITVGKKHVGAVVRNKLKRRIKAWFRANAAALPNGLKINLIAKEGAASLSWSDLSQELSQLADKLNQLTVSQQD